MPFFRKRSQENADNASIASSEAETLINEEIPQTATGRPQRPYNHSGLVYAEPTFGLLVQHLPHNFTDQTIIPVPVLLRDECGQAQKKKSGLIHKIKTFGSSKQPPFKVVRMPRAEYIRHFARDTQNNYIGTEPERAWSAAELEEEFGHYQQAPPNKWIVNVPSGLRDPELIFS